MRSPGERWPLLRSLTFRLALGYLALFTVSMAVLIGIVWWTSVLAPLRDVREAVAAEVISLVAVGGGRDQLVRRLSERAATPADRKAFHAVIGADGEVVDSNLPRWPVRPDAAWLRFEFEDVAAGDYVEYEVVARQIALPDGGRVLVGRDTEDIDEREELVGRALIWGSGITVGVGIAGGVLMSLAVGRRIEAVGGTARRIIDGDLAQRIPLQGTDDDFDRLAGTLNAMLDRIAYLIEAVRGVSDNVAHELRTPLTRLRADLEELAAETDRQAPSAHPLAERAIAEVDGLQATFDAILRITRVETGRQAVVTKDVDISELCRDAAELYEFEAGMVGKPLVAEIEPGLATTGDKNLLFQAVANLIDNATKYAPAGTPIVLRAGRVGDALEIAIVDRGSGIPIEHRARATERFFRIPHREEQPGLGLGLALAAAVARVHRAELAFRDTESGFAVLLRLPIRRR